MGDSITTNSYNLSSNGYNIDFRPSQPIRFSKVDSLALSIGSSNAPQQVYPSIWNFQTEAWQTLTLDSFGGVSVPEAWQFIGMDGEILLNIQGDPNSYFGVTSVDFTLMV